MANKWTKKKTILAFSLLGMLITLFGAVFIKLRLENKLAEGLVELVSKDGDQ